jgi:hypothetical protein
MIFRSRKAPEAGAALADCVPRDDGEDAEVLLERIESLTAQNRAERHPRLDGELMKLRHRAGVLLAESTAPQPEHPDPAFEKLPSGPLPEVDPGELTPALVRAGILTQGCLLVRGLIERDEATGLAAEIDRAFEAREALKAGGGGADGYYEAFVPDPPYDPLDAERPWIAEAGGVWGADSPRLMFDMLDAFAARGIEDVIHGYLGEAALISVQKCTLRKAQPATPGAWHQDGAFMGDVRSVNLWVALSHCGDEAPGLDVVPRRIDHILPTGGEGTMLPTQISQATAEEAAKDVGILRPIFEPGDAMFFDDLFLHKTGSDPQMPKPRYAIESWFFGRSGFPDDYVPLAL